MADQRYSRPMNPTGAVSFCFCTGALATLLNVKSVDVEDAYSRLLVSVDMCRS
jgi:hypothetical protein